MPTAKTLIAEVDVGSPGHPGTGATKIRCRIFERSDGRYDAEGYYSEGCNQGYYQENYGHGPWNGRGATPRQACDDMIARADDEYQRDMRDAAHDALLALDD